ncbi:MAG TPA: transketolase C-terminal domain-containing protein [Thermoplasmata archaeon]|nr:transketolase C-terminal domain-containing protein [Thermoplasmata archaeon]
MVLVPISGNAAQAYAARLARVAVVAAYPITPQTSIIEKIEEYLNDGTMKAQYLHVESEHSAMAACIAASAAGVRTYTASSSQGVALMHELLHWASGARAPVVMGVVNRAMAMPWSVWTDHADTISQRDTGWMQFYAASNQEVLDTVIMAFRLAEEPEVLLPAMVMEDAFYLSHTVEAVELPGQDAVDAFLPPFVNPWRLDVERPGHLGGLMGPDLYMEHRYNTARGMERALALLPELEEEFRRRFGRDLGGPLNLYRTEGADAVLVAMGTIASTAKDVVDRMREEGHAVGLAQLRAFRPFPVEELRELARDAARIGVVDRSFTYGAAGAAFTEVCGALYHAPVRPWVKGFIAGVGGRDVTPAAIEGMFRSLLEERGPEVEWVDLRKYAHATEVNVRG